LDSKDLRICKQVTDDKIKHPTLTTPHKPGIIRSLESGESQRQIMSSYNIGSSSVYDTKQ
jgi:hypothetical protein